MKELLSDFNKDITDLIGKYGKNGNIRLAQFSDSIVLFSDDIFLTGLMSVTKVACGIMVKAIEKGIPLNISAIKCDLQNIRQTVSDAPRKYIDNTLIVINTIDNN